jgi:hypothetical protein
MEFAHDLLKTYVETLTRVVGPTTLTFKRGTLPQPLPTDANTIFVAMNGSDANPGTLALPKQNIGGASGAINALGGAKLTVHIFRNGYVGDLIFPLSTVETLGAGENIQVIEGEIATIESDGTGSIDCVTTNHINGIAFTATAPATMLQIIGNGPLFIENCSIIVEGIAATWDLNPANRNAGIRILYSFFRHRFIFMPTDNNTDIVNSILMQYDKNNERTSGITFSNTAINPAQNINITRSIFYGWNVALTLTDITQLTPANAHTLTLRSNVFLDCNYAFSVSEAFSSSTTAYHKILYQFSYLSVLLSNFQLVLRSGDAVVDILQNDLLDPTLPRMYTNEAAGIAGDADGFRLQIEGKDTPDGGSEYLLSSILLGAGFSGEDIAPFDESVTGPTLTFRDSTAIVWDPRSLQIPVIPINPVETTDVRGSYHNTYDGIRREWTFRFQSYCNNENARKLVKIMHDKGSIKFYPVGMTGVGMFTDAHEGFFDTADNSFAPASALGYMIPVNWQGWWITINGDDFYIDSNDATKFYLVDKLNAGWPSGGVHDFKIRFILVQPRRAPIVFSQDNFTAFTRGGAWREKADTEGAAFEYQDFEITLLETEDLVENV